jgi:hypothetical protein
MRVTDLANGESLTITNGRQTIVWKKKDDKHRRMHFIDNKLHRVSDDRRIGTADNEELVFRLANGFKVVTI